MNTKRHITNIIMALGASLTTAGVVFYSEASFYAALQGLQMWWEIVVPALLPFFILAEILMALGVVHFIGCILEPIMQPLFRIPGIGAFAFAMGLASGYPVGAKITGDLRRGGFCTRYEGERLLCLANTADPLFMIGAIAIGMFHLPELTGIICISHYLAVLGVGLIFRFYGPPGNNTKKDFTPIYQRFTQGIETMIKHRQKSNKSFGNIFGEAVNDSVRSILLIGGFIVIFSVFTELVQQVRLDRLLAIFLAPLGLDKEFYLPLLSGLFEITNGTSLIATASGPLIWRVSIANALIAWSGLSVHAQTSAMVQGTDLNLKPYILARFIHSLLAFAITLILWQPLARVVSTGIFTPYTALLSLPVGIRFLFSFTLLLMFLFTAFILCYMVKTLQKS